MILKMEADFYVATDAIAEILPPKEEEFEDGFTITKEIVLDQVASLLGDEVTSDVIISARTTEDVEIGTFFCHTAILGGNVIDL